MGLKWVTCKCDGVGGKGDELGGKGQSLSDFYL